MSILIEVVPERWEQFEDGSDDNGSEPDLAERLLSAYHQRFAIYEKQLADTLRPNAHFSELELSDYPGFSVDVDGEEEDIAFDFSLYETLLEIYVFEGWGAVRQVEQKLDTLVPTAAQLDAPSGGVPKNPGTYWVPAKAFFSFTRNLVAVLIRETLVEIERKAALDITSRLDRSAELEAKAWNDEFRFDTKKSSRLVSKTQTVTTTEYRCKNRGLSTALYKTLSEVVQQKDVYETSLKKLVHIKSKVQSNAYYRGQGITATPYDESEEDIDKETQLGEASKNLLEGMLKVLHGSSPLGLIVVDGLKVDFTQEEMEQKLGIALGEFHGKIEAIRRGIDPNTSRVAAAWTALLAETKSSPAFLRAIQNWEPPKQGFESYIAESALSGLPESPSWFPLAHEETWHRLVETGALAKDSFEYIVYYHYVSEVMDRVEAKQEAKKAFDKFWNGFSRTAAALSLASLATPITAEFAPVLRGLSAAADLATLAYTIHSVYGQLAQLDQSIAEELVHPDAFALEHLARIGELAQSRREAVDQIEQQILFELATTVTGAGWVLVKKLTLARGYYFDLETFLADGEEPPN